jgi:V/A-type H+/Na+-transporting ATPase subunit E
MALDKVVEDILESARKDASQLIATAEKEKASVLQQANESIAAKRLEGQKQLDETIKRLKQQEVSSGELEAKRIVLNVRKDVLDQVSAGTLKELASMPDSEKARLYTKLLTNGATIIPQPKVFCPKGEAKLLSGVAGVGSIQEIEMEAGVILESKDGMFRLDYRFKTLLEDVWEKELKNVSNILFM